MKTYKLIVKSEKCNCGSKLDKMINIYRKGFGWIKSCDCGKLHFEK